ncbi:MAG: hypothetical protein V4808_04830 [Pseudomonadota bacterium]
MARIFGKAAIAVASLSLAAVPALASGPSSALSLRAATASKKGSEIAPGIILGIIGLIVVVGAGTAAATGGNPDSP